MLFLIIFFWTPPHFWALSLYRTEDYARAGVPMLPVVAGARETRRQILLYTLILAPLGIAPWLLGYAGPSYGIVAAATGAIMIALAFRVRAEQRRPLRKQANVRVLDPLSVPVVCHAAGRSHVGRVPWLAVRAFRGMTMSDAMDEEPPPTGIKLTEEQQRARRARSIAIAVSLGSWCCCSIS